MSYNPLVSIIIPVYNGSNYLREAIDSALAQTYPSIEVLVVNDGSSDDGRTEEIALSYGDRIRYFPKPNGGVSSALNLGIANMKGDYFSWLSHDDLYSPTKVEASVELLRAHGFDSMTLAYTGGTFIDKNSKYIKDYTVWHREGRVYSPYENIAMMLKHGTFSGCALLVPREAFSLCGGFDESLRYAQDSLMWYRLFDRGYRLAFCREKGVMTRLHSLQGSQTQNAVFVADSGRIADELIDICLRNGKGRHSRLLYYYALRLGKLDLVATRKKCLAVKASEGGLTLPRRAAVALFACYGKIRGSLKRIYYKYVLKV